MTTNNNAAETTIAPVSGLVPMIQVADVERSIDFYRLLGFEVGNKVPRTGRLHWAWLYAPKAADWKRGPNLMLTRGQRTGDPVQHDVLFYLYAADLVGLRQSLIGQGISVGEICYPDYLPQGEFRLLDPDGYTLMLAQAGQDTP